MRAVITLCCLIFLSPIAFADDVSEARNHYQRATNHFAVGEFTKAGEEYQAAYKLKPDPALLFNAAQAFRLGGDSKRALVLYRNYLSFYPNESNAEEVRVQIEKLRTAIESEPVPAPAAEPPRIQSSPTSSPEAGPLAVQSKPARRPVYKQWWLWTAVGVVVAAGVTTGVVLGTRSSWSNAPEFGPGSHNGLVVP
jgi:tetratricopeptide (TPR) repeat protein